jgi:hypothetical protein
VEFWLANTFQTFFVCFFYVYLGRNVFFYKPQYPTSLIEKKGILFYCFPENIPRDPLFSDRHPRSKPQSARTSSVTLAPARTGIDRVC